MVASGPSRGWRECDGEEESGVDRGVGLSHLVTFVASDPSLPFDLTKNAGTASRFAMEIHPNP